MPGWFVLRSIPRPLFWRVVGGIALFLQLRLIVLLILTAAIDYDGTANPALLAFLFVNAVVFDAVTYRLMLEGLDRAGEAHVAQRAAALGIAGDGVVGAVPASFLTWSTEIHDSIRRFAAGIAAVVVGLVLAVYLFLLSPVMLLILAVVGVGVFAAGFLLAPTAHADLREARQAGRALTDFGVAAAGLATLYGRYVDALGRVARNDDNRLVIQSGLCLAGAGFVAIGAPIIVGPDPAAVARICVAVVLLWAVSLALTDLAAVRRPLDAPADDAVPFAALREEDAPAWQRLVLSLPPASDLAGVDLSLARGTTMLLCGGNGTGKSRLMARLAGRGEAWQGSLQVDGEEPVADAAAAERLRRWSAFVSDAAVLPDLLVDADSRDELTRLLPIAGLPAEVLDPQGVLQCHKLSQVLRMRAALALGMLSRHPTILLDGFLNGQDGAYRDHFENETLPYLRSSGCCVVVASHDPAALRNPDRLLILQDGRLVGA